MHLNNTIVRFRNNKPYLLKKTIITLTIIGLFTYMIISLNWLTCLILFLFVGLPIIFKVRKQPSEGKGFFGKVKNFYKNMYKDYVIDEIPIDVHCDVDKITINLHKAEFIKNVAALETFEIQKDNIAGILFDDTDNDFLIMFQEARVTVLNEDTSDVLRTVNQLNSTICFRVDDPEAYLNIFNDCGFVVEKLSEIQDEEEETEDPELVAQQNEIQIEATDNEAMKSDNDITESNEINNSELDEHNDKKIEK